MARDFKLNSNAAREANSGGKRITEPGAYTGTIKQAWYECNDNGTESVNLTFASDSGQEAGPLALYTHNGKGEELPSFKTFNAILACLRLRSVEAKPGKVTLWDGSAEVQRQKDVYPAMIGKRIGLVLQGEEYVNRDGDTKMRLLIAAPYCAETRRMAAEVLDTSEPKALDRYLTWFEAHKVKAGRGNRPQRQQAAAAPAGDGFEDDIPF